MKHSITAAALAVAVSLGSVGNVLAHGGNYGAGGHYGGPRDVVPPGAGPATGGGSGGPSTPGVGGPATPGPAGPSTPGAPGAGGPATGGGGPGGPGGGPGTGGVDTLIDLTRWQMWWELNKEPYLDLRRHLYSSGVRSGSDEFFMGRKREAARDALRPSAERIRDVVVPALFGALERESSNDVLTGAMVALAKIGDPDEADARWSFRDRIASFLTHPNQEVAETAALSLGILGDTEQIRLLSALLRDDRSELAELGVRFKGAISDRTRSFAAFALGLLGATADHVASIDIVLALTAPIADGAKAFAQRDVPVACVLALGLVALPPAPDGDVPSFTDGEFLVREHQIAWLLERFADRKRPPLIRAQMPRSLARLVFDLDAAHPARRGVIEALLASLQPKPAEDTYVQQSCVLALGQLGDCDADELDVRVRAALMRAHEQCSDQQVKRFTLIALAQVCGRAGADKSLAGLQVKRDDPRAFLIERVRKAQGNERCWAALALGVLERSLDEQRLATSKDTRAVLRWALGDAKAADDVGAYAIACGLTRDREAVEPLLEKLEKMGDPEARGYVALALGMIGDPRAKDAVRAVVAKSKYQAELLRSAATALALIGDAEAVPRLTEMLTTTNSLFSQAAIATALGTIGDARSIDPLLAILSDGERTAAARGFAAAALGIVADHHPQAWISRFSLGINYRACTGTLNSEDGGTGLLQLL